MDGDTKTSTRRCVAHLRNMHLPVEVRIDGETRLVDVHVYFSNHCWTKSRSVEPDDEVLFRERQRNGSMDERVFCELRHAFSQQLPTMIASLAHALCIRGASREVFYRVKTDPKKGGHAGWYVCLRLGASHGRQQITLSVRSAHYRTNRPADVRGKRRASGRSSRTSTIRFGRTTFGCAKPK